MAGVPLAPPEAVYADAAVLWEYHQMHDPLRPTSVGIGLGSHDPGVATYTAELYHRRMFPVIVFTGANAPTTLERFPRGEAVHYRELALSCGVPDEAILVEPTARNTAENIERSRDVLTAADKKIDSVTLISRPYQQRRAYATCRKLWPEVAVVCASQPQPLGEYLETIGDVDRVINMLVGDTQRITVYAEQGFAIHQHVPARVLAAFERLVEQGYTSRLLPPGAGHSSKPEVRSEPGGVTGGGGGE